MHLVLPLDIAEWQTVMLGYLGQEAIAHGALVFATLAAAFAFACGFADRASLSKLDEGGKRKMNFLRTHFTKPAILYFVFNLGLLWSAVYAVGRTIFYGGMANQVMFTASFKDTLPAICKTVSTLTNYWTCMRLTTPVPTTSWFAPVVNFFLEYFGSLNGVSLVFSMFFAFVGAFLILLLAQTKRNTT
jgi:hypothetical protein